MEAFSIVVWTSALLCIAITGYAAFSDSKKGGQSMKDSILETWSNIAIGFGINFTANMIIFPMAGFPVTAGTAFSIGIVYTAISVVRQFVLRRLFNCRMLNKQRK